MWLRALALLLAGLLPATGHADKPLKTLASGFEATVGGALSHLRSDSLRRDDAPADNLNPWRPGPGVAAQVEVTKSWAVRLDANRYRPKYSGGAGRENLDSVTLGVQYSFGDN